MMILCDYVIQTVRVCVERVPCAEMKSGVRTQRKTDEDCLSLGVPLQCSVLPCVQMICIVRMNRKEREMIVCLRVEFLLKTDSGYPKDMGVTLLTLATPGNPLRFNTHRLFVCFKVVV